MARDFNIRDRDWNSLYPFYFFHSDFLIEIANSFEYKLSSPIHQVPTCYVDNHNGSNFVIDLLFHWPNSVEMNNHFILPDFQHPLYHTPLMVNISIIEEVIQEKNIPLSKITRKK